MNYFASAANENDSGNFSLVHSDSHHADIVVVPDVELLTSGEFHRAGLDLVITAHDGRHYVLANYFATEHPATLVAPNGAHLSPDVVDLLTGSLAPNEYAQVQTQMQTAVPPDSIGKVQKIVGTVAVLRNGVSVALNVGDVVYKSDVIVTGADSKVGLTFPDGTALQLLANTRMALNEYGYDASSTSNQTLFTLVEGTFGFVAGKVAHSGDMKIITPVATMGIRGTTGVVEALGSGTYSFSVYDDPGTTTNGWWDMLVQNSDGTTNVLTTVSQTGYVTYLSPQGIGQPPLVRTVALSDSQRAADQLILQDLFATFNLSGPHSTGSAGSGDNPLLQPPPNFHPDINGAFSPFTYNDSAPSLPGLPPLQDPQAPPPQQAPLPVSTVFIWPAGNGTWPTGPDWNQGASPDAANDIVILQSGMIQYDLNLTIDSLTIEALAELKMIGGELATTNNLDVAGILFVDGAQIFASHGTATIEADAEIIAGARSVVKFSPDPSLPIPSAVTVDNFGALIAQTGGALEFIDATVTNALGGLIESTGSPSTVSFTNAVLINSGAVLAANSGGMFFVNTDVINNVGGSISVENSLISLSGSVLNNFGDVQAGNDGAIVFISETIVNEPGNAPAMPGGSMLAVDHGFIGFDQSTVTNSTGASIAAGPEGGVEFSNTFLLNETGGCLTAASFGVIFFDGSAGAVTNLGTIEAKDDGLVLFNGINSVVNEDGAKIEAINEGTVQFEDAHVTNYDQGAGDDSQACGLIAAFGQGAVVDLVDSTFAGGVFATGDVCCGDDGIITIVAGTNTVVFDGSGEAVTIDGFVQVDAGAALELFGAIHNDGTIDIDGAWTTDLAIAGSVSLCGSGVVTLEGASDQIVGVEGTGASLENFSTIDGAGSIGVGDEALKLVNEVNGHIDADMAGQILTIDTGNTIQNMGTLEASHGGILQIDDPVNNCGGSALITGGILEFGSTTNVNQITFDNGAGGQAYGELIYETLSKDYAATIHGFTGVDGSLGGSDAIDLAHIQGSAISYSAHGEDTIISIAEGNGGFAQLTLADFTGTLEFNSDGDGGTLITDPPATGSSSLANSPAVDSYATANGAAGTITFSDAGSSDKPIATLTTDNADDAGQFDLGSLTENNGTASFKFSFDEDQVHLAPGQVSTQSYDVVLTNPQNPAATQSQSISVTVGGAGNDNFVFAPGVGADTLLNFNPQHDTIELDHFGNAQTVQELQSLITTNVHDNAVIDLGNHDSITLANTTSAQLQQAIQTGHVILH
jgi:hypothetical protein